MERKYRGPETAGQLWDRPAIRDSHFDVGTQVTDHFEVVDKNAEAITLRCGGSVRDRGVREGDGLFEVSARVDEEREEVVLGLKSVFFQGLGKSDAPPMKGMMQYLHITYAVWMLENAARQLKK